MTTLAALYFACVVTGSHPADCWGVALTESGMNPAAVHRSSARGVCGTKPAFSPVPAWAMDTAIGGSVACAVAIRDLKRLHGRGWTARYVCGARGVARRLPACVRAARKLEDAIARLKGAGRET